MNFLANLWKDWSERRARQFEFDRADRTEMTRIAAELGTSATQLRGLVDRGANAAELLMRRMRSLDLDPKRVEPAVMRDLQRCCSLCRSKTLCTHELEDRPQGARWPEYCPNELTINALQRDNGRSSP